MRYTQALESARPSCCKTTPKQDQRLKQSTKKSLSHFLELILQRQIFRIAPLSKEVTQMDCQASQSFIALMQPQAPNQSTFYSYQQGKALGSEK